MPRWGAAAAPSCGCDAICARAVLAANKLQSRAATRSFDRVRIDPPRLPTVSCANGPPSSLRRAATRSRRCATVRRLDHAVALMLVSAALHAGWNLAMRRHGDAPAASVLLLSIGSCVTLV